MKKKLLLSFLTATLISSQALALTAAERKQINYDAPWWGKGSTQSASLCTSTGPSGGLRFPAIQDESQLAANIDLYIKTTQPSSPLNGYGSTFVSLGKKYNVSPAFMVSDAEAESSLGTTGQQSTRNYYGIRSTAGYPSNSFGFAIFPDVATGIEEYYKIIGGPRFLGPPANMTDVYQITSKTTPWGDGPNNPRAKADHIIAGMNKIMTGVVTSDATDTANVIADTCGAGVTEDGAIGWSIGGAHPMVNYDQTDPQWASRPYGAGKPDIGSSGCGPTSVAMIFATLLGRNDITPVTIADRYGAQYHVSAGTSHGLFGAAAADYGLKLTPLGRDLTGAANIIKQGGMVVIGVAPPYFTSGGHLMVLRAVSPDGNTFFIADPNGKGRRGDSETRGFTREFLQSQGGLTSLYGYTKP